MIQNMIFIFILILNIKKNKFLCSTDSLDDRMNIIYENNISCLSKQIEHYLCYKLSNKEMKNFFDKLKIKYSIHI